MPKKPINYANCMFYRLVCRDPTVKEVYVGHTTDESNRRRKHKNDCTNEKGAKYNFFVYRFIRDHGGFDNWQMLVEEKLAVADDVAARLRERYWCEHFNATLNSNVPGRTRVEYRADHREEIKITDAAYRTEHREEIKITDAAYYAEHRDEIKITGAAYYAEHRDEIKITKAAYHVAHREKHNQQSAAWAEANTDHLKEKHDCPCGGKFRTSDKARHSKSLRHIAYLAAL